MRAHIAKKRDPCASPCLSDDPDALLTADPTSITPEHIMQVLIAERPDILEQLHQNPLISHQIFAEVCTWAIELRSSVLLYWLIKAGHRPTKYAYAQAAADGDLDILRFIQPYCTVDILQSSDAALYAAAYGHHKIMKWLIKHGYHVAPKIGMVVAYPACATLPEEKRLSTLIWLHKKGLYTPKIDSEQIGELPIKSLIPHAALSHELGILRWAIHAGFEFDLNQLHRLVRVNIPNARTVAGSRYLAMGGYLAHVVEHELCALGRPQHYIRELATQDPFAPIVESAPKVGSVSAEIEYRYRDSP